MHCIGIPGVVPHLPLLVPPSAARPLEATFPLRSVPIMRMMLAWRVQAEASGGLDQQTRLSDELVIDLAGGRAADLVFG